VDDYRSRVVCGGVALLGSHLAFLSADPTY